MQIADFIGLPYKPKGRNFSGVDCYGVAYLFQREIMGNEVPSYAENYSDPDARGSVANAIVSNAGNWLAVDTPERGDVILFNLLGLPVHCGVYVGDGDFLHSLKGTQTCIERLDSITWSKRIYRIIRWQKN